jgi:hypothetical protein
MGSGRRPERTNDALNLAMCRAGDTRVNLSEVRAGGKGHKLERDRD